MSATEVAVAALACWQAVEAWHHGEIFAGVRARLETWDGPVTGFLADGLLCPFCTSFWTGWACVGLLADPHTAWLAYGLAAARLANLGNDLAHARCRTPRRSTLFGRIGDDAGESKEST